MSLSRKMWLIWFISALYFSYEMFQLTSYSAMQDNLLAVGPINAWQVGLLSSIYLYGCALFILPAGMLIDSYPVMPLLASTLFIDVLGVFLMLATSHYWLLVLGRGLTGIGNGFSFLGCMRLITDWFSRQDAVIARGLTYTVGMFGCILSQTPYKFLIEKTSLYTGLMVNASIGAMLFFLVIFIIQQPKKSRISIRWIELKYKIFMAISNKQNILSGLYACIINLPLVLLGAFWGNRYLVEKFSITYFHASKITSLIFWGLMVGAPLMSWLARTIKRRRMIMCLNALFASTLVFLMISNSPGIHQIAGIFFLLGIVSSGQLVSYYISAESSQRAVEETSLSVVTTCINIGGALLQALYGELISYLSPSHILVVVGSMFILSLIAVVFLHETYGKNRYS